MKNIYLLILLIIFLYIICNRYIENFSVGCQSSINISSSLTLSSPCNCSPSSLNIEKLDLNTNYYSIFYWKNNNTWQKQIMTNSKLKTCGYTEKDACGDDIIMLLECLYDKFKITYIYMLNNELKITADESVKIKITFSNNESVIINIFIKKDKSWTSKWIDIENKGKIISIELLPRCPKGQKWSSTENKCEYQCRCVKLFHSDVCNQDIEERCHLATDSLSCPSKSNPGRCTWYD